MGWSRGALSAYLALVMAVGPLLHYSVSALGPLMVESLGLTATQFGSLWLFTFGAASVCTITAGVVADILDERVVLIGIFVLAFAAVLIGGVAGSYGWLLVALSISGAVQSLSNPVSNRLVAAQVERSGQGVVLGIKQSGVQGAQLFAGLVLPSVAVIVGWRYAIIGSGLIVAVGLLPTMRLVPLSLPDSSRHDPLSPGQVPAAVWWLSGYAFLLGIVVQATNVYLPLYLYEELEASVTRAGLIAAVLGGFGVLARLLWGGLAGRVTDLRRLLSGLAVVALVAVAAVFAAHRCGEWLVWVGASMFSFSALAANAIIMLAVVRVVPSGSVGRGTGRVSLGLFLGFMVGPLLAGIVVDRWGFLSAWAVVAGVAALMIALVAMWRRD
ncbi:MFS transporter [Aeromicrobium sp. YIM 150415]|uniref:MFS transporter n=1 Tax=Aeromicrobium sp. YIM 150415 TaxID=2803912 RepID=UPI0019622D3D|nr:MFS transporter [Aeromicrobium sp. YIM 150415]MBM9462835.1 MFS transporter [Aeromicrobium sp. YIM 150415]